MPALFWDAAEGNDPSPNWHMKPMSDLLKPRLLVPGGGRVELPNPFQDQTAFKTVSVANLIDLPITMVPSIRLERMTSRLQGECSTN